MVLYLLGLASLRSFCFAFSSAVAIVIFGDLWAITVNVYRPLSTSINLGQV